VKVLIATCAHRGDDARIVHRQAATLLGRGHDVLLVAPLPDAESLRLDPPKLERVAVKRSSGRRRVLSWIEVRRVVRRRLHWFDVLLVHDPELVPVVGSIRSTRNRRVWDVHEDFRAVGREVSWLPRGCRWILALPVRLILWWGRQGFRVIVAEAAYRDQFPGARHVPNTALLPDATPSGSPRRQAIYVGRLSYDRGLTEMVEIGRLLVEGGRLPVVLVGACDDECRPSLERAVSRGWVEWLGPQANPQALKVLAESWVGLCLLRPTRNYLDSYPSKIGEYFGSGLPVITTPIPRARSTVEAAGGGFVTESWEGPRLVQEVVAQIIALIDEPEVRNRLGSSARAYAVQNLNWANDADGFVQFLESVAQRAVRI
jgi:glycosyltransferase involved in cell wall biosynthesis